MKLKGRKVETAKPAQPHPPAVASGTSLLSAPTRLPTEPFPPRLVGLALGWVLSYTQPAGGSSTYHVASSPHFQKLGS